MPENCQLTTVDTAHLKLCCHNSSNDIVDPVVNRSSSASSSSTSISCDNRSDYISSDLSEGLSLSDSEDKTSKDCKLEISDASSQMYHHVPIEAYDEINDTDSLVKNKQGNGQQGCFSNGIIPVKEVEHLDTIGTPEAFKRTLLNPVKDEDTSVSLAEIFEEHPLQSSSPKQVNFIFGLIVSRVQIVNVQFKPEIIRTKIW